MIYDFRKVGDFGQNDTKGRIEYKQKRSSVSGRPKRPTFTTTKDFNELNFVLMNKCHVFIRTCAMCS